MVNSRTSIIQVLKLWLLSFGQLRWWDFGAFFFFVFPWGFPGTFFGCCCLLFGCLVVWLFVVC